MLPERHLHSAANFHVYDAQAKMLMSGDIGAAIEKSGTGLEVDDFESHIPKMEYFHSRWMPFNAAKNDWIERGVSWRST